MVCGGRESIGEYGIVAESLNCRPHRRQNRPQPSIPPGDHSCVKQESPCRNSGNRHRRQAYGKQCGGGRAFALGDSCFTQEWSTGGRECIGEYGIVAARRLNLRRRWRHTIVRFLLPQEWSCGGLWFGVRIGRGELRADFGIAGVLGGITPLFHSMSGSFYRLNATFCVMRMAFYGTVKAFRSMSGTFLVTNTTVHSLKKSFYSTVETFYSIGKTCLRRGNDFTAL